MTKLALGAVGGNEGVEVRAFGGGTESALVPSGGSKGLVFLSVVLVAAVLGTVFVRLGILLTWLFGLVVEGPPCG